MDLNQVNNFLSVAQTLSFSGAARRNGVPQSTVSRHISDLESELGVRLFYRTKRDVKLTDEGRAFLPYAKEIVDTARKAAYVVKQLHEGAEGRLSIAVVDTCQNHLLAQCLRVFGQRYPEILVDITDVSDCEPELEEREDRFDFHFIPRDSLPEGDDFDYLVTHQEEMAVVVAKHHPLAGKPLNFSALQSEKFIIVSEEQNPLLYLQLLEICRAHHFSPTIRNRLETVKSVLLAVGAGLGVTMLPSSVPQTVLPDLVSVLPIDDMDTSITYVAAWKKELLNPAAALFLEVLRETLEQSTAK
ncbi:MAG: LysR family transcriptional regulator [Oscillospiraceae bacterium]|nr:LysR family transcriptional regulator [Oscillospiraceae bacterium]